MSFEYNPRTGKPGAAFCAAAWVCNSLPGGTTSS